MTTRAYRQDVRAQQTQANTDRIVSTAVSLVKKTKRTADITLDDMSRDSGVTVRTILRRFGSRDGVLEAAFGEIKKEFQGYRMPTRPGDVDAAVRTLLDQYERIGDLNMRALEQEQQLPLLHRALTEARRSHREWLEHIFGPQFDSLSPQQREARLTALYAATDVYLWKLLRRDLKLDRRETEEAFLRLVHGVLAPNHQLESRKRG
jgi:AcrR family transcriptional regulator